jgi:ABC-type dipeptide/oligopeptide/nickel transport system ATPase subunit
MKGFFLDREEEFEVIVEALSERRSLILHGEAGCGKSALLRKVRRYFETSGSEVTILCVSPTRNLNLAMKELAAQVLCHARPKKETQQAIRMMGNDSEESLRRMAEHSTTVANRAIILREFRQGSYAIFWDHTGFLSQTFCKLCKRLIMEFNIPQVFAGRSCHMEDVGYISKTLCGPGERLALKNLDDDKINLLIEHCMKENGVWPSDVESFKNQLLDLSGGNAGRIVKMCEMAAMDKYRSGQEIKLRLIHIDSQLGELDLRFPSK